MFLNVVFSIDISELDTYMSYCTQRFSNTTSVSETFEFDKAVKIEGNDVPAGKYSFYIIPEKDEFVLIFGKDTDMPAYKYNDSQDQLRVKVKPKKSSTMNESLVYNINKKDITLSWENLDIPIVIE